jgi:hypothetical protein
MSRLPGSAGCDFFRLAARTPGPLGHKDAADPDAFHLLGDSPGSLGVYDCADPDADSKYGLGIPKLHVTISQDKDLLLWDYDPDHLLEDDRVNPEFVSLAHEALSSAVNLGLRPRVHEVFRSPQESDRKHAKYKAGTGGKAAPGWQSAHNYGLAMDVWLYDRKKRHLEPPMKGWYAQYKQLAKACSKFIWGEPFDDADHFEYHPNWPKPAKGKFLISVRKWAMQAAAANGRLVKYDALAPEAAPGGAGAQRDFIDESDMLWQPYFWWAAGASGGDAPPSTYMASNKAPTQA